MSEKALVRENVLRLIDETFGSDAAFERARGLPPKTVSNWRRGRSSSYLKMLPEIAELFGVRGGDLVAERESSDGEEANLVRLWRESAGLTDSERRALYESVESIFRLYLGIKREDEL